MIHYFLLGADRKDRNITILREIYPPGSNTGDTLLTHNGEEGGIIIRGQITLTVGGETQVMKPGDGYYFSSHIPHRFSNDRKDDCEIISANSPPSV